MDFRLNEEQRFIQKMVREFVRDKVAPIAAELDRTGRFPAEVIKEMAGLGMMGIPIPREYGGGGASFLSYIIAIEELSRGCASTGVICETHTSLGTEPILHWGTEEQKRKYVVPLARGEKIGAFALTEPNAGSDAAGLETTAVLDGDEWVLNGSKMFISNGTVADVFTVMAMTDKSKGTRGISAFIVEKGTPGFIAGPPEDKMGIRASSTAMLTFDNCRIPRDNLLGSVGQGFKIAMQGLDGGRVAIAAQALGIAQSAFDDAVKYAGERQQFGRPISKFQGVQWMIADMATEIQAARFLTYHAAWLKDQGKSFSREAAMAKLFASEAAMRHTTKAVQVHGGYGFMKEYPVERHMRDAKITEIYEGTSEVQRMVIAGSIFK